MVLAGLDHDPVLLRRLPFGDPVDEATSKQASSTASVLVSFYLLLDSGLLASLPICAERHDESVDEARSPAD